MQRSAGVSTVAIVVLIGSILVLGLGLLTAGFALVMPQVPPRAGGPPMPVAAFLLASSLMYVLPGVWGVVSGIGLWRLRNWARISTMVFAVVAGLGGVMALVIALVFFALPPPGSDRLDPAEAARAMAIARTITLMMSATLLGIAIWWGVLLTRPTVVRQFTGSADTATTESGRPLSISIESRRPVSITIVAVLMLIGAAFMPLSLLMRAPVALFTTILTGGASMAFALAVAGTLTYGGVGLLRLRPVARLVSIGYFVFGILNSSVFFLAPGRDARMAALIARQHAMFPFFLAPDRTQVPPTGRLMVFAVVAGLIGSVVPLYFLVTRRAAFKTAASDPIWPDAPG